MYPIYPGYGGYVECICGHRIYWAIMKQILIFSLSTIPRFAAAGALVCNASAEHFQDRFPTSTTSKIPGKKK
jgi:hypothetical protein